MLSGWTWGNRWVRPAGPAPCVCLRFLWQHLYTAYLSPAYVPTTTTLLPPVFSGLVFILVSLTPFIFILYFRAHAAWRATASFFIYHSSIDRQCRHAAHTLQHSPTPHTRLHTTPFTLCFLQQQRARGGAGLFKLPRRHGCSFDFPCLPAWEGRDYLPYLPLPCTHAARFHSEHVPTGVGGMDDGDA